MPPPPFGMPMPMPGGPPLPGAAGLPPREFLLDCSLPPSPYIKTALLHSSAYSSSRSRYAHPIPSAWRSPSDLTERNADTFSSSRRAAAKLSVSSACRCVSAGGRGGSGPAGWSWPWWVWGASAWGRIWRWTVVCAGCGGLYHRRLSLCRVMAFGSWKYSVD